MLEHYTRNAGLHGNRLAPQVVRGCGNGQSTGAGTGYGGGTLRGNFFHSKYFDKSGVRYNGTESSSKIPWSLTC